VPNYAEIIGDEVHFYDRSLREKKNLQDVLKQYAAQAPTIKTPRLPENCKFLTTSNDATMYFVELPPRLETLRVGWGLKSFIEEHEGARLHNDSGMNAEDFYVVVPVPWEYYVMSVSNVGIDTGFGETRYPNSQLYLFWAKHQITTTNDPALFAANLPNISKSGDICLGDNGTDQITPDAKINDLVYDFYHSTFNDDLGFGSGICLNTNNWLSYANLEDTPSNVGDPIDLSHELFKDFPDDGGSSIDDIAKSEKFTTAQQPQLMPGGGPKVWLTRVLSQVSKEDGARLLAYLKTGAEE